MALSLPLEGDGLVSNLYYFLWAKDDFGDGPQINVPATICFEQNQPVSWYFTSKRSGQLKKKTKTNVTTSQIDQHFTKDKTNSDIVAYYIAIQETSKASAASCNGGNNGSGNNGGGGAVMEYFDVDSLRDFLYRREKPNNGILQKFILPKGTCNTTIRAIWSPKICLLERQVNLRNLYDKRFSIYERGVTFDGADRYSRSEPVRGAMLPGEVQHLCEQIVHHVARVSYHKNRISRMVLHVKADANDKLWLLWSSSMRLLDQSNSLGQDPKPPRPVDLVQDLHASRSSVPLAVYSGVVGSSNNNNNNGGGGGSSVVYNNASSPCATGGDPGTNTGSGLNPTIRHGVICVSCGEVTDKQRLVNTNYRAILEHFDKLMTFLRLRVNESQQNAIEWPPDDRVIQAAGGVGFGTLRAAKTRSLSKLEVVIPPVVRFLHPNLSVEEFDKHRHDPIFLHRRVAVCEKCYLVYADYSSFALESNTIHANAPAILLPHRMIPELKRQLEPLNPLEEVVAGASTAPQSPSRSPERGGGKAAPMRSVKDRSPSARDPSGWQIPSHKKTKQRVPHKTTGPPGASPHKKMMRSISEILLPPPQLPQRIEFAREILQHEADQQDLVKRQEAFFTEMYRHPQQLETCHPLYHMLESDAKARAAQQQLLEIKACFSASDLNVREDRDALFWTDAPSSNASHSSLLPELYEHQKRLHQHSKSKNKTKSPYLMVQRLPDSPSKSPSSSPKRSPLQTHSHGHHKTSDPAAAAEASQEEQDDHSGGERKSTPGHRHKKSTKKSKKPREQRQLSMEHRNFLHEALQQAQLELEHTKLVKLSDIVTSSDAVPLNPSSGASSYELETLLESQQREN